MNNKRIELLKKGLNDEPKDPFYPYALAMEYKDSEPLKAFEFLNEAQEKFPDYLPIYFQLAELAAEFEEVEKTEEIYKAGIALAENQKDLKTLAELKNAYQNFLFENM